MQLTEDEEAFKAGIQALLDEAEGKVRLATSIVILSAVVGGQIGLDTDDDEAGVALLNVAATVMSNTYSRARKIQAALNSGVEGHA